MKKGKKIVLIVLGIFVCFFVCFIATGAILTGSNNKEQADQEEVLEAAGEKKVLIIYQDSRSGSMKKIDDLAAKTFQENGYTVVMNHPRKDSTYHLEDYDVVVLSSPVYTSHVSEPLLQFTESKDFSNNKVLILLTGQFTDKTEEIDLVKERITNAKEIKALKVSKADDSIINIVKELIEQ